ncbi:hypothetical protein OE88DRAFT_1647131 [Heliocybe sulcata]|uniref:Uncharacterized protein n=1 Tax=Heliocybe sulcata TaxID=5364 RepID=A0A5C3MUH3_9AGAM|nr:hypothetical protein OE88DRAFT_1647131 [Heliocybe sulcata]
MNDDPGRSASSPPRHDPALQHTDSNGIVMAALEAPLFNSQHQTTRLRILDYAMLKTHRNVRKHRTASCSILSTLKYVTSTKFCWSPFTRMAMLCLAMSRISIAYELPTCQVWTPPSPVSLLDRVRIHPAADLQVPGVRVGMSYDRDGAFGSFAGSGGLTGGVGGEVEEQSHLGHIALVIELVREWSGVEGGGGGANGLSVGVGDAYGADGGAARTAADSPVGFDGEVSGSRGIGATNGGRGRAKCSPSAANLGIKDHEESGSAILAASWLVDTTRGLVDLAGTLAPRISNINADPDAGLVLR